MRLWSNNHGRKEGGSPMGVTFLKSPKWERLGANLAHIQRCAENE